MQIFFYCIFLCFHPGLASYSGSVGGACISNLSFVVCVLYRTRDKLFVDTAKILRGKSV